MQGGDRAGSQSRSVDGVNAERVFREFRARRERGEPVDIEAICEEYPGIADQLRNLNSLELNPPNQTTKPEVVFPATGIEGSKDRPGEDLAPIVLRALESGDVVGEFRIVSRIGGGAFGTVYCAEQEGPVQHRVALKFLTTGTGEPHRLARFWVEGHALARMQHPNIAAIHRVVVEAPWAYLVMELVEGVPLLEFCDRNSLDIDSRLALFIQLCDAVQHAHQKRVIHRDLKPDNILVTVNKSEPPAVKVVDFGLAKVTDTALLNESMKTVEGQMLGTPVYMSPEQWYVEPDGLDIQADVYALGVVLYELVTGCRPFDGQKLMDVWSKRGADGVRQFLEANYRSPSDRLKGLSPNELGEVARKRSTTGPGLARDIRGDLEWVVARAMEVSSADRYSSVEILKYHIERIRCNEPIPRYSGIRDHLYRGRKFFRRNRVPLVAAAAMLLLAAALLGFHWLRLEKEFREAVEVARGRVEGGDLDQASQILSFVERRKPDHPATAELRDSIAGSFVAQAAVAWEQFRDLRRQEERLYERWRSEAEGDARNPRGSDRPSWRPVWERQEDLALWDAYEEVRGDAIDHFDVTELSLRRAIDVAAPESEAMATARDMLADVYWDRRGEAVARGAVEQGAPYFERLIRNFGSDKYTELLDGAEQVVFRSDPPGATVYCFKYEEREARRVPLPFDPRRNEVVSEPFLRIEKVWKPELCPGFEEGDRILEVNGHAKLKSFTDFVAALQGVAEGESIRVKLRRSGSIPGKGEREMDWVPFDSERTEKLQGAMVSFEKGAVRSFYLQFGFTLDAYPLEFLPENRPGTTGSPLELELGRGSYLFVLRKPGYLDCRYPLAIPHPRTQVPPGDTAASEVVIRLLAEGSVPPGFVYVPGGIVRTGGDREAFQGLPRGAHAVPGFLMGRLEVTFQEWDRFINHPSVLHRIVNEGPSMGRATPVSPDVLEVYGDDSVLLVPRSKNREFLMEYEKSTGKWAVPYDSYRSRPVPCVSRVALLEYIHWKNTVESAPKGIWRYRLPTDLEWERAARGADRRIFVWGDYPLWNYCWSLKGAVLKNVRLAPGGISPCDESVFGVRDLAGSLTEHTSGFPIAGLSAYRGGSFMTPDDYYFRISTINSLVPTDYYTFFGARLVADLPGDPGRE